MLESSVKSVSFACISICSPSTGPFLPVLHMAEPFFFAMQAGAKRAIENLPSLIYRDSFCSKGIVIFKPVDGNCFEQTADYEDAHAAWSEVMSVLSGFVWDLD